MKLIIRRYESLLIHPLTMHARAVFQALHQCGDHRPRAKATPHLVFLISWRWGARQGQAAAGVKWRHAGVTKVA